jgi:hypothetical protein
MRPQFKLIPGYWYYTVKCRACRKAVRFFVDETRGKRPIAAKKNLDIECFYCGAVSRYHTSEMTSTQEPNDSRC